MFTGIIQTKGTVVSIEDAGDFRSIVVSIPKEYLNQLNTGASIAINGVCLTVVKFEVPKNDVVGQVFFDVIDETLKLTNLSEISQGSRVNVERSVAFGTEIGGHIVSGHIHTKGKISTIDKDENNCAMFIEVDARWMKYILHKGFVTIDGASLTVGSAQENGFYIHLIPETLQISTLGERKSGEWINIEIDQQTYTIVETVERYFSNNQSKSVIDH